VKRPQNFVAQSNDQVTIARAVQFLLPAWGPESQMPTWPPDVFAVVATLLKRSGAYIKIVNHKTRKELGINGAWSKKISGIGIDWRQSIIDNTPVPGVIQSWWKTIASASKVPISNIGANLPLLDALICLLASADESCWGIGVYGEERPLDDFDDLALMYLLSKQCSTLCQSIHASAAMVLPKLHTPLSGMTMRSLTHNLALWDNPEVKTRWIQLSLPTVTEGMNVLLLPWPLEIHPTAFSPVHKLQENIGTFAFNVCPMVEGFIEKIKDLISIATARYGPIHALVFPELSMGPDQFRQLWQQFDNILIIGGVGELGSREAGTAAQNYVMAGIKPPITDTDGGWPQHKHHRWRLDRGQIEQYGIGNSLDASYKWWWEDITIRDRECNFFCVNDWLTFCILLCEDLARQDPVADLVRTVGPNLVIGLLLDGPQLEKRWSARYATVLAEDPRCSVLTLTSAGLVDLSRSQGLTGKRSIALWKDALSGVAREICLDEGSDGVVLNLSREWALEYTADGRSDKDENQRDNEDENQDAPTGATGYLRLTGVHQVRAGTKPPNL